MHFAPWICKNIASGVMHIAAILGQARDMYQLLRLSCFNSQPIILLWPGYLEHLCCPCSVLTMHILPVEKYILLPGLVGNIVRYCTSVCKYFPWIVDGENTAHKCNVSPYCLVIYLLCTLFCLRNLNHAHHHECRLTQYKTSSLTIIHLWAAKCPMLSMKSKEKFVHLAELPVTNFV